MIMVTAEPIDDVEPVPIMPRLNSDHLRRGSWVRHVGFGPTEGGAAHQYKSTLLTRTLSVGLSSPTLYTWGDAGGGDSGSPVFQRRMDDHGQMREVLVGVLTNEGIRSIWIDPNVYSWIRSIVDRMDPTLLPEDYDGDGIENIFDSCLLKASSESDSDRDEDGVGASCDTCSDYNGGQFDSDDDGRANGCDPCPIPSSFFRFDRLNIPSLRGYWTQSPFMLEFLGVESDGRWLDEEFTVAIDPGSGGGFYSGLSPTLTLDDGRYSLRASAFDGCGNLSETHTIDFGVDSEPPTLSFNHPEEGAMIPRESNMTVEIFVGDMSSGIGSVELWLDAPGMGDEFNPGIKLCDFPGPWLIGYGNVDRCTVNMDFPFGTHTLYAIAKDVAGNETIAQREIMVWLSQPGVILPTLPPLNTPEPLESEPTPTPTATNTSIPKTNTPAPVQKATLTPTPKISEESIVYSFDQATLEKNGWSEIPGGFMKYDSGDVIVSKLPANSIPSSEDNLGLAMTVMGDEVALVYSVKPFDSDGKPVLLRLSVRATGPDATLTLACLKGGIQTQTDGSVATHSPATAQSFVKNERTIVLIYQPDDEEPINPIIQVAGIGAKTKTTVYIDRLEAYVIEKSGSYLGELFYSDPLFHKQIPGIPSIRE